MDSDANLLNFCLRRQNIVICSLGLVLQVGPATGVIISEAIIEIDRPEFQMAASTFGSVVCFANSA